MRRLRRVADARQFPGLVQLEDLAGALWKLIEDAFNKLLGKLGLQGDTFQGFGKSLVDNIVSPFKTLEAQMGGYIGRAIKSASNMAKTTISMGPITNGNKNSGPVFPGFGGLGGAMMAMRGDNIEINVYVSGNTFGSNNGAEEVADEIADAVTTRLKLRGVNKTGRW